jgi:hypothetical protein
VVPVAESRQQSERPASSNPLGATCRFAPVRGNNRSSPDVVARQRQAACRLEAVLVAVLVVGVAGLSVAVLSVLGVLSAGKDWSGN